MRQRKTLIISAIIGVLAVVGILAIYFAFQNENPEEPPLEQVLEEKLMAYETDLLDSLGSMETNADVTDYLLNWAKNKQIPAVKDRAGNVIYTVPAAEHVQDAQPSALLCSFDADSMDRYVNEIAFCLTAAKNVQNNGPLQIIFLAEEDGDKTGIQGLDMHMIPENAAVFCLGTANTDTISTVTGGFEHISISKELSQAEPEYNKAFRISLVNCPEISITSGRHVQLNPVKTLGGVLANLKSTSLLFELSDFKAGNELTVSPSSAAMTIVINDSDTAKFERKMKNSVEKVYEKYHEKYPELAYTYEEVDLPSSVFAEEDTENLVSLMYTLFNGIYHRDEEGTITAVTNIGTLSTNDSQLRIDISIISSDESMMQDISEEYETICGLCDVKFNVKERYPVYDGSTNPQTEELFSSYAEAYWNFTGGDTVPSANTAVLTNCTFLQQKNEQLPILFCSISEENIQALLGAFVTWADRGEPEK